MEKKPKNASVHGRFDAATKRLIYLNHAEKLSLNQYLRQNALTCQGFCRRTVVEL